MSAARPTGRLPRVLRRRWARPVVRMVSRRVAAFDRRRLARGIPTFGGRIGGTDVLLLTTTGRRTGRPRAVPLLYHRLDDGSLLLIGANGAADWDPDWIANLRSKPDASVIVDSERSDATASVLGPDEREALWSTAVESFPGLAKAQECTRRAIPLVVLRCGSSSAS